MTPQTADEFLDDDALAEELLAALCQLERAARTCAGDLAEETGEPKELIRQLLAEMSEIHLQLVQAENGKWFATPEGRNVIQTRENRRTAEANSIQEPNLSDGARGLLVQLAVAAQMTRRPFDPILDLALPELESLRYVVWTRDETYLRLTSAGLNRAAKIVTDPSRPARRQ